MPALWLATATVEHPIKKWFRRRRPFVSLIEAIIVGRKPGRALDYVANCSTAALPM